MMFNFIQHAAAEFTGRRTLETPTHAFHFDAPTAWSHPVFTAASGCRQRSTVAAFNLRVCRRHVAVSVTRRMPFDILPSYLYRRCLPAFAMPHHPGCLSPGLQGDERKGDFLSFRSEPPFSLLSDRLINKLTSCQDRSRHIFTSFYIIFYMLINFLMLVLNPRSIV
jgi:hypothetical protein